MEPLQPKLGQDFVVGTAASLTVIQADVEGASSLGADEKARLSEFMMGLTATALSQEGVVVAKSLGDGIFVAGTDADTIIHIAFDIRDRFAHWDWLGKERFRRAPLLRVAVDHGDGVIIENKHIGCDVSGSAVERASRIEPLVEGGQVWASPELIDMIKTSGKFAYQNLGEKALAKNAGSLRLFRLFRGADSGAPKMGSEGAPPSVDLAKAEYLFEKSISMNLLRRNGDLSLTLVTLPPPSVHAIANDESRPGALAAARQCLTPDPPKSSALVDSYFTEPSVLLFSEFAFASPDWDQLDAWVQAFTQPLICIAPFGAVPGNKVSEWFRHEDGRDRDGRHLIEDLAPALTYNGMLCWVHIPGGGTTCYGALKTYREQRHEVDIVSGEGSRNLVLAFNDVLLFPAICAELLNRNTVAAYRARLAQELAGKRRPVLITGSLYQSEPWAQPWNDAISELVSIAPDKIVVALANQAFDALATEDVDDQLRDRSGVFCSLERMPEVNSNSAPSVRASWHRATGSDYKTKSFGGAVVRCTEPAILLGRISWPPRNVVDGLYLWEVLARVALDLTHRQHPISVAGYEIERWIRRKWQGDCLTSEEIGRGRLVAHLREDAKRSQHFAVAALGGPAGAVAVTEDMLKTQSGSNLTTAARDVAVLAGLEFPLATHTEHPAHIAFADSDVLGLVWRPEKKSSRQIALDLGDWVNQSAPAPPLVVITTVNDNGVITTVNDNRTVEPPRFVDGPVLNYDDDDKYSADAAKGKSCAEPRAKRKAVTVNLQMLEDARVDPQCEADLINILTTSVTAVTA